MVKGFSEAAFLLQSLARLRFEENKEEKKLIDKLKEQLSVKPYFLSPPPPQL